MRAQLAILALWRRRTGQAVQGMVVEVAVSTPALLGECPVWSVTEHVLYWIDIDGRIVHRYDPVTGTDESRPLEGRPGSLVLTPDPGVLVVATEHRIVSFDWRTAIATPLVELEPAGTGNRLNDGRCDPGGRYVVGSMFEDTTAGRTTGVLHRFDGTTTERLLDGIGVTNGLAFDGDRGRMYFADTFTDRVQVFDYDASSGELGEPRLFLDYRDLPGKPDGACLDADGCYWSASVYGWSVIRVTPDGVVDRRIELPVEKPSMPAFGGADLSTLYVTTIGAGGNVPSAPGRDGVAPGALLAIELDDIRGVPEPVFESR